MIGARDMAFPRLNAFSFWMSALGGLFLYFSFFGGNGLYGAGSAPDVGWFAYAPLTAKTFSVGHSTDFWTLSLLSSGIGSIGTAINIIATILCMRCPGMTLGKMPLLVWLNLVMAGLVILAVSPLSAAQIMLAGRPLPRRPFLRYASRRLGRHLDALLLDLRTPRGLCTRASCLRVRVRDHSRLFTQGDLRLPSDGAGDRGHRIHRNERLGPSHVHRRHECGREHVLRPLHHGDRGAYGHQNFQLAGDHVGRQDPIRHADAVLRRLSFPVSSCRIDRSHARRSAARLATRELLLRGGSLSLRDCRRHSLHAFSARSITGSRKCPERCTTKRSGNCTSGCFLSAFI